MYLITNCLISYLYIRQNCFFLKCLHIVGRCFLDRCVRSNHVPWFCVPGCQWGRWCWSWWRRRWNTYGWSICAWWCNRIGRRTWWAWRMNEFTVRYCILCWYLHWIDSKIWFAHVRGVFVMFKTIFCACNCFCFLNIAWAVALMFNLDGDISGRRYERRSIFDWVILRAFRLFFDLPKRYRTGVSCK